MKNKNNLTRLYVHPEFKYAIKVEAIKQRTTILKLTERLAKDAKEQKKEVKL